MIKLYGTALSRASRSLIALELQLHRIMANYVPTNDKSARLLRRLGFSVEGYAPDYLFLDGVWKDHILTSLHHPNPSEPATP